MGVLEGIMVEALWYTVAGLFLLLVALILVVIIGTIIWGVVKWVRTERTRRAYRRSMARR